MPKGRFFLPHRFSAHSIFFLQEEEHHHLSRVMRCKTGETIELVNGKYQLAKGLILEIEKNKTKLEITDLYEAPPPQLEITLIQALLRPSSLELVIEKGTELGASSFLLFPAHKSERASLTTQQAERLHSIVISALKQCGRLDLPSITFMPPLKDNWLSSLLSPSHPLLFGDLSPSAPPLLSLPKQQKSLLCIGPESGFSQEELTLLSHLGKGISLHPNILRAETAALCGLSLLAASP